MTNLIKLEINKVLKPVIITFVGSMILSLGSLMSVVYNFNVQHTFEFWNISLEYMTLLFPILVVCPTCWVMYYERKHKFIIYTFPRVPKIKYLFSKWIVCILSAFLIIFIPMLTSGLLSFIFSNNITPSGQNTPIFYANFILPKFLISNTYMYIFVHCLWDGFLAIIIASLGFMLSLYVDNILIILTGPFIYATLDNFIMANLGFHKQRLLASFHINSMTNTNILNLLVGPIIVIIFIAMLVVNFKIKRKKIYDI